MIKQPPYLKKGDKIAIVCPAKKLPKEIDFAIDIFQRWGLEVIVGQTVHAKHHQFAGNDNLRAADLQTYLDDPEIKAIIAGRGGYGTIRIIDELEFTSFNQSPKWIVGFSDITVLLAHINTLGIQCIHGQMPIVFDEATPESLQSLHDVLFGGTLKYITKSQHKTRSGTVEGEVIGGNLTLLAMVQGSVSEMNFSNKILFLEDVGEHEYSIDRTMRMLKRAGKLSNLAGLIVGAFNELKEEEIPFGQSPEEIIWEVVKDYNYPICFNFPVGHIDDNRAMILGKTATLQVAEQDVILTFN